MYCITVKLHLQITGVNKLLQTLGVFVLFLIMNCAFKCLSCTCLSPQFFAMGVSSMFILPLSGAVSFPTAVIFISAAVGFNTFASGYVGLFKTFCLYVFKQEIKLNLYLKDDAAVILYFWYYQQTPMKIPKCVSLSLNTS